MLYNHITEFKSNEPNISDAEKTKPMKENVNFDIRGYSVAAETMFLGFLSFSKKNMSSGGAAGH